MTRRRNKRRIDGVLFLDKPQGLTSNGALQRSRRLLEAAKAGHTGTLDPMATGLLPLTFGEATKFSRMLLDADKEYVAQLCFGSETDTGDAEGTVCATFPGGDAVTMAALEAILPRFRGEIEQIPPMHSALKRDGKPLYEYARAGIEVERAPRAVTVHEIEVLECTPGRAELRVACSKGTYIRTLAQDIGRALGCGAHLTALRRTAIGPFRSDAAVALETLETASLEARDALLAPVDSLVANLPEITLEDDGATRLLQGATPPVRHAPCEAIRVYGPGRSFLGLARVCEEARLIPLRLISTVAYDA